MDDQTRRRLIKGSVAAPLVLTVGKAGANARTTFSACLTNSEHQPEPTQVITEQDEAFRVSRDVYELNSRGGRDGEKPPKPEVSGGRDTGKSKAPEDRWSRDNGKLGKPEAQYVLGWDNRTVYRIDGSRLVPQQLGFGRSFELDFRPNGKKVDLLAYLDDNGEVVGLAPERNGGQWTTKRCYDSIMSVQGDTTRRRSRWWG